MTDSTNYNVQLQASAESLRLPVPGVITNAIVDKISLIQDRASFELPESIIYAKAVDSRKYISSTHVVRVRASGWQFEIVKASSKSGNEDILIAIVKKIGSTCVKQSVRDYRDGNNPIRARVLRK